MRYAVLGAAGQLGRELCKQLAGEAYPFTRSQMDLTRPETFSLLHDLRPDVILNCSAYNFVDRAESEPEAAFAVNAFGVRNLALLCRDLNCTLVHFSTDHAFGLDENRRTPYTETDLPGPVSAYGTSKLAGEYFVRSLCPRHLVIRTCGLYGPPGPSGKGTNFVATMLRLARAGKPLRVVNDQTCTPTYVGYLTAATRALVPHAVPGLYHITNAGSCTWFEFAQEIFRLSGISANLTPISSAEYGAPARRPSYSVLETNYENLIPAAVGIPSWQYSLADFLKKENSPEN